MSCLKYLPLALAVLALLISGSACETQYEVEQRENRWAEQSIAKDQGLKDFDDICRAIPMPAGSKLVGKKVGSKKPSVTFKVDLNFQFFTEAKIYYMDHFERSGWTFVGESNTFGGRDIEFKKQQFRVAITDAGNMLYGYNYRFGCYYKF